MGRWKAFGGDEAGTASALVDDAVATFFEVIGAEAPPLLMRPARPCSSLAT